LGKEGKRQGAEQQRQRQLTEDSGHESSKVSGQKTMI
jgi:hypothetical protein